jgi:Terpene cyclase DEP1
MHPTQLVYAALGLGGLVGTYYFNVQFGNLKVGYLEGWFANSASSSASVDLLVVHARQRPPSAQNRTGPDRTEPISIPTDVTRLDQ